MPFLSRKQARFAHANPSKFGGEAKLKEWDDSTDWSGLPEKVAKKSKGWMSDESAREKSAGTKGTFSAAARKAGKTTAQFAEEKQHAPGKLGQRARMAKMYLGAR